MRAGVYRFRYFSRAVSQGIDLFMVAGSVRETATITFLKGCCVSRIK